MLEQAAKNIYFNFVAIASTIGLSLMDMAKFLDGVLPSISLFLTTLTLGVLLYIHLRSAKKVNLEIKKLQRDLHK